jgi:nucleotide-binding universal stress UspA family protein
MLSSSSSAPPTVAGRVGCLSGSTAAHLLQSAPCPVVLAPDGYTEAEFKTIAVAFADTPEGHAALAAAHALATRAQARLRVITVLHPTHWLGASVHEERGILLQGHHRGEAEAALEHAIRALAAGVEIESEAHVGDAADVLLRVSESVDLLVCGSRGYGPSQGLLHGSVSRRLIDGAHCPALVLPRAARPLEPLTADAGKTALR